MKADMWSFGSRWILAFSQVLSLHARSGSLDHGKGGWCCVVCCVMGARGRLRLWVWVWNSACNYEPESRNTCMDLYKRWSRSTNRSYYVIEDLMSFAVQCFTSHLFWIPHEVVSFQTTVKLNKFEHISNVFTKSLLNTRSLCMKWLWHTKARVSKDDVSPQITFWENIRKQRLRIIGCKNYLYSWSARVHYLKHCQD